jgi:nicotinic acid mononucleotide adenylyltransferase
MLDSAVKWLSNMANYNVVAARLAVAPDSYVEKKCKRKGDRCIKAEHRIKLCELACSGQKLIKAHFTTTHSARNCGENVKKWENFKNAKVAVVIGADKAAFSNGHWKWKAKSKCLTVCVGRKGQTEAVRKAYAEEFKEDLVTNPDFIMIEDKIDNINSTEIRQQLSGTEYDMKYGVNNQTNEEIISNPRTMKEHSSYKNMTDESLNDQENRKVPLSCDELPDEELESMNLKDDYTEIIEGNVGYQINEENIPLSWEEIETVDDLPAACNSPKSDLNIHNDKNSSLEQEKYGARFKTRYSGSIDLKETVNELNDKDQSTNKHSRKYVIDNLVSNGWLAKPVGDYMLEKFFDLYL